MTVSDKFKAHYGNPTSKEGRITFERRHMALLVYPADIAQALPCLGKSVYCNKDLVEPLTKVYRDLISKGLHTEIKTNDQCFNVREIRGVKGQLSIHSWGMAVDLNPADNPLGVTREQAIARGLTPFTEEFIQVWRDNGWKCGADFRRKDLMHFEYAPKGL